MWVKEKLTKMYEDIIWFVKEEVADIQKKQKNGQSGISGIIDIILWVIPFLTFIVVLINDIVGAIQEPQMFFSTEETGWFCIPANMLSNERGQLLASWVAVAYTIFSIVVLAGGLFLLYKRGHKVRFYLGLVFSVIIIVGFPILVIYFMEIKPNGITEWKEWVDLIRFYVETVTATDLVLVLWIVTSIAILTVTFISIGTDLTVFFIFALASNVFLLALFLVVIILGLLYAAFMAIIGIVSLLPGGGDGMGDGAGGFSSGTRTSDFKTNEAMARKAAKNREERIRFLQEKKKEYEHALMEHSKGSLNYMHIDPKVVNGEIREVDEELRKLS